MPDPIRSFRIEGPQSFAQAVDDVDERLRKARAEGASRVLVDVRGLTGFGKPDLLARLGMVRRWAATAGAQMRVAMLCSPEFIDGERFGVVVARGLGFDGDVFENEEDARHWLDQQSALWTGPPPSF